MSTRNIANLLSHFEDEIESLAEDVKDRRQKLVIANKDIHDLLASLHEKKSSLTTAQLTQASKINDGYVKIHGLVEEDGVIDSTYLRMKEYLKGTLKIIKQYRKEKEELIETLKSIDRELKTLNNEASSLLRGTLKVPSSVKSGGKMKK